MIRKSLALGALLAALLAPALALAYGTRLHRTLASCALAAPGERCAPAPGPVLPGIRDADLDAFRRRVYDLATALPDSALRAGFRARFPSAGTFDARAFKEFLMMNGAAPVLGVDSFAAVYRAMSATNRRMDPNPDYVAGRPLPLPLALQLGSMYPDLDRRNQDRLLRDEGGAVVRAADGDTVPFDPMSLNMGRLTGLSSQAHAHYGLNRHAKSSDPSVLRNAPWDFAIPAGFDGPVETYASANAQLYSDLALLAALDGRPAGPALGTLFAGAAMHYIADVGNAIHTLQVGIYEIFRDATIQYWLRRARTLFGLLGASPSRNAIGITIVTNLHTLSERLFETELTEARAGPGAAAGREAPDMRAALAALDRGDDSLARALADTLELLRRAPAAPDFGRAIATVLTDAGNRDGAAIYHAMREIAKPELSLGRIAVDFDTVPDERLWEWLRVGPRDPALARFNAIEARGLARTTTALRAWWAEYRRELGPRAPERGTHPSRALLVEAAATRLVRERLAYLAAAEARRQVWISRHGGAARR